MTARRGFRRPSPRGANKTGNASDQEAARAPVKDQRGTHAGEITSVTDRSRVRILDFKPILVSRKEAQEAQKMISKQM
jgi:hypothetical protein